jgi:hypothetical protein
MKMLFTALILLFAQVSMAQINGSSDVEAHFRINGSDTNMLMPGKPATIEVWYTDKKTGEVFKEFKEMHGKFMHMVILRSDMHVFKHIHPYFDPVTGRFLITINMPLHDPDNFHTANAIDLPGMYMIMADVEIRHVGMRMGHKMVHAMGNHAQVTPILDPLDLNGVLVKEFTQHNRDYKIEVHRLETTGCAGNLVEFQVTLFEKDEMGNYLQASELEDWLTQGAHSVWVSEGLMNKHKMHFAHMHSKLPEADSTFVFNFHDLDIMKAGIQKAWFQIKHKGNVLTIPVVFDYAPNYTNTEC